MNNNKFLVLSIVVILIVSVISSLIAVNMFSSPVLRDGYKLDLGNPGDVVCYGFVTTPDFPFDRSETRFGGGITAPQVQGSADLVLRSWSDEDLNPTQDSSLPPSLQSYNCGNVEVDVDAYRDKDDFASEPAGSGFKIKVETNVVANPLDDFTIASQFCPAVEGNCWKDCTGGGFFPLRLQGQTPVTLLDNALHDDNADRATWDVEVTIPYGTTARPFEEFVTFVASAEISPGVC